MLVDRYPASDGARILHMLMYEPARRFEPIAGVLLLHGGALQAGAPEDMAAHCEALASRGIFAASAGYRLLAQGARGIDDCLRDVHVGVARFVTAAKERGLSMNQLATGGSSAGAHLALLASMPPEKVKRSDDPDRINVVIALNPAGLDLSAHDDVTQRGLERRIGVASGTLMDYSLLERVRPGGPAVLIQHGTADEVESIGCARRFRNAMTAAGNQCVLIEYKDAPHAFHYPGKSSHTYFNAVIEATTEFLTGNLGTERTELR